MLIKISRAAAVHRCTVQRTGSLCACAGVVSGCCRLAGLARRVAKSWRLNMTSSYLLQHMIMQARSLTLACQHALAICRMLCACRAQQLLQFVHDTRQRLLRLRAISHKTALYKHNPAARAVGWLSHLQQHALALEQAPDSLLQHHQLLSTQLAVPLFDVASAYEIATTGRLQLPAFISDLASDTQPTSQRRAQLVAECNALTLQLLQQTTLPDRLQLLDVRGTVLVMRCLVHGPAICPCGTAFADSQRRALSSKMLKG